MNSKKEVQHVYLVGAKSLGAYGGYETFVYKLTEYHQNKENIKYHVACKANGDGCMDESKFEGVTKINDHEFEFHNAHCFKIDVPQIGSAQAIYYDVAALKACCEHMDGMNILFIGIITQDVINQTKSESLVGSFVDTAAAAAEVGKICNAHNSIDLQRAVYMGGCVRHCQPR